MRDLLAWRLPVVVTLSCAAIGMPLLDIYGRNPTVFVTANLSRTQIITFGLLVVLVPVLLASLVEVGTWLAHRRAIDTVHTGLVALFSVVLFLSILRKLTPDIGLLALGLALALGAAVALGERSWTPLRTGLRYAAVLPVVVWFLFFFTSPTARLFGDEATAVAFEEGDDTPASAPPVVFIILDELPLVSLVGSDGDVRSDLFPNFARLQQEATWYRNTTANSPMTELSVPSLLSGRLPQLDAVGSTVDWPNNLFTLLGDRYQVEAHEEATRLCPASVCGEDHGQDGSLGQAFEDAAVVLGHLIAPSTWRSALPSIDDSWGGFEDVDAEADTTDEGEHDDADDTVAVAAADQAAHEFVAEAGVNNLPEDERTPERRLARLHGIIDDIEGSTAPTLYFAHVLFPHKPWQTTPGGHLVVEPSSKELLSGRSSDGPVKRVWFDDPNLSRIWLQRHLLQVGAADRALGDLFRKLEDEGLWDEALIVVTADHGASFTPGHPLRGFEGAEGHDEMYRVPLFIKAPRQRAGEVVDAPAQSIDILPTMVDLLDLEVDWEFDGRSLVGDPPDDILRGVFHPEGNAFLPNDVQGLFDAAAAKEARFAGGSGWLSVAAVGPLGHLVGQPADQVELEVEEVEYDIDQADRLRRVDLGSGASVPIVLTGSVELGDRDHGREMVLVVNGTVAGIAHLQDDGPDAFTWAGLIAEELLVEGDNEVELWVPAA